MKEENAVDRMAARFNAERTKIKLYEHEFKTLFGVDIRQFYAKDALTISIEGFKLFDFDDYIKTPDNIRTSDYLKQKYGARAEEIIKALL